MNSWPKGENIFCATLPEGLECLLTGNFEHSDKLDRKLDAIWTRSVEIDTSSVGLTVSLFAC